MTSPSSLIHGFWSSEAVFMPATGAGAEKIAAVLARVAMWMSKLEVAALRTSTNSVRPSAVRVTPPSDAVVVTPPSKLTLVNASVGCARVAE